MRWTLDVLGLLIVVGCKGKDQRDGHGFIEGPITTNERAADQLATSHTASAMADARITARLPHST